MAENTGKVREKSGNFVSPEKWEPWVCVVAPRGVCMVAPGGCAWLLPGGGCVVAAGGVCMVAPWGCAWDMTRYGDTINERAVRILLECILVVSVCSY